MLVPVFSEECPVLSLDDVGFSTGKQIFETRKSLVSHGIVDGEWSESAPCHLEESANVQAYVKNDQRHFAILYEWNGETRKYAPDYLLAIAGATWIVEMERPPAADDRARWGAAEKWIRALNNSGRFGLWKHVICRDADVLRQLVAAPAPPTRCDGSELVGWREARAETQKEWWETSRTVKKSRHRRRGSEARWHATAKLNWFIPPPSSDGTTARDNSNSRAWLVPCRCGSRRCDGVRTVTASDGTISVQFIGMHIGDFIELLQAPRMAKVMEGAVESARGADLTSNVPGDGGE